MRRVSGLIQSLQPHLPLVAVVVFPILIFADVLLTDRVLFWGLPALQFNPWRMAAWESLLQGSLPFWNPWNGMGAPLLANYQLALFYPPGWILYLFAAAGGAPALAWGHSILIVLHLIWAGFGMVRLLARMGVGNLGQSIAGLAFCLSGYMVARNGVFPMIWAGAWLPWVILQIRLGIYPEKNTGKLSIVPVGLAATLAMLFLSGHAQLAWYTTTLAGVWVIFEGFHHGGLRGSVRGVLRFGLAGVAAAILASPQLVATAEFLSLSQRSSAVDYELGMQYSFWPWRFLAFFAPNFFGTPADGSYWGYASYWEDAAYIGLLPLVMAFATLRVFWQRKPWAGDETSLRQASISRFFWVVTVLSLILALGKNLPVYPFLYRYIPTFDMFQAPARYLILTDFSLAVLAGIGVDHWQKPIGVKLGWLKRGAVAAAAIALGAGAAAVMFREIEATFIGATALAGAGALLIVLLTMRMPDPADTAAKKARWTLMVVVFIGADLIISSWGLHPATKATLYSDYPANDVIRSQLGGQRVYLSAADEYVIKFWRFFRFDDYRPLEEWSNLRGALLPNLNILDKIPIIGNFDPLLDARYARWMKHVDGLSKEKRLPWLRVMGVGAVEAIDVWNTGGVDFELVENAYRWYWSNCASFTENPEQSFVETASLIENAAPTAKGLAGVVLETEAQAQNCDPTSSAVIKLMKEEMNRVSFSVDASAGGWLVLADTWYPGWKAEVDGERMDVVRANFLFRAVVVPKGQHVVVFTYSPDGYYAILVISLACWLGLFLVTPIARRKGRAGSKIAKSGN